MKVPTFEILMLPLLKAIEDRNEHDLKSASKAVARDMELTDDVTSSVMPGKNMTRFFYNIQWSRTYLKYAGLVEIPKRGFVKITEKGTEFIKDPPDIITRKIIKKLQDSPPDDMPEDDKDINSETPEDTMRRGLRGVRCALYDDLMTEIKKLSSKEFELLALDLCRKMGYAQATPTGGSGDRGIDGIACKNELGLDRIFVQAKKWTNPVGPTTVRDFVGALVSQTPKRGIFVTTSTFTDQAMAVPGTLKDGTLLKLVNGKQLVELMDKYGVGVSTIEDIRINKTDSSYFENLG